MAQSATFGSMARQGLSGVAKKKCEKKTFGNPVWCTSTHRATSCARSIDVECIDGLWECRAESLNLCATGECREDALRALNENFAFLWREYAEEDDAVLDDGARELKRHKILLGGLRSAR
jgi:hypothetical protein